METLISSDDSCDQEIKNLKTQLTDYGLEEENLSKDEMFDILKALKNSKSPDTQQKHEKVEDPSIPSSKVTMKRRYLNVRDRRMPWSLIPQTLEPAEKARTLAVYIKLMSLNNYRQARQSVNMAAWPPPIQIIESTRIQPQRSTRSGRSVPVYTDYDDDSSDFDCIVTKIKKRKISNSEQGDICPKKSLTLKRKNSKDDNARPIKEVKIRNEIQNLESEGHVHADLFSVIED